MKAARYLLVLVSLRIALVHAQITTFKNVVVIFSGKPHARQSVSGTLHNPHRLQHYPYRKAVQHSNQQLAGR